VNIEAVVYIARKLHWTRSEIGSLTPHQFNELLKELYFQESVEEYRKAHTTASILAAIYNTIPRKAGYVPLQAKDFLSGDMPTRDGKPPSPVDELAKKKGIKIPSK
jgi:hypothetical protein